MPNYFQRPENALKRANEFIDVGKKQPALDALYDVIKSKKHRTWQKIHEPIMEKYLDLCVELRKSHTAKEGLYQYKNICQQVNVRSLEDVVRGYLRLAEQKTEEARKASAQSVLDIDDLDNLASPEDLLLSAVSGEDVQARTDRVVLIPWVKFLWESYRQCLDLLRNNNRVEKLYQDIAQDAFRFCQKYQRKTEFRKLCDNLRNHLGLIQKHQNQTTAINLNNPESQQMHLDTRLFQLDTAISMELWQEAYKAVEDIHSLMELSKKSPKPQMMANYYQKLGLVFWKSGNGLFHACALHRLLQLSREQRKFMEVKEIQRMASRVLLATLAIPIIPPRNDIGDMLDMGNTAMENQRKLANLLKLQAPPNRMQLVKDLVKYNIIQYAMPQVKDLYNWLEVEFHPLHLCERVTVVLDCLTESEEPELVQYVTALQNNTVQRLLKQISQVYDSIQFSRLCALVPFATPFHLERMVVDASRNGAVQVRVDHSTQALIYGSPLTVSQKDEQQEEGPRIQDMPADQIRNQLSCMSIVLHKAVRLIQPAHMKEERLNEKQLIIQSYRRTQRKEHERILQRRHIIEDRKEKLETISVQREKHEQDQIEQQQRSQREAEQQRLEREALERARKKQQEEIEEIQKKHAQERIKTLKQSAIGQKVFQKLKEEELSKMDADEIMAKHVEQLEAEKKELQARLKSQEKKVDHFARAMRIEEISLLKEEYEEKSVEDRTLWDQMEEERIAQMKTERQLAIKTRDRLSRMGKDKDEFINNLKQSRLNIYKVSQAEYQDKLHEARTQRLMDRKIRRKEERRTKWIEEKTEREQIRKDEEAKRLREEAKLKEETEYNEKMQKLQEQELKQAARMREIEEKLAREKDDGGRRGYRDEPRQFDNSDSWRGGNQARPTENEDNWRRGESQETHDKPRVEPWRPKVTDGGWRDREKKREDSWRRSRDDPDNDAEGTTEKEERDGGAWRTGEREKDREIQKEEEDPKKEDENVIRSEENEKPRDEVPQRREIRSSRFASRDIRLDEEGSNIQRPASRDIRLDEDRGEKDEWRKDGPRREYGDRGGRDFGDRGGRDFGDSGGRNFGDRGGRDFGDRGGRDFGDRGGRDFGGRDFGDRGGRDFGDRGGRDYGDRGGRNYSDRGVRDFGDRGGRDFGDRGGRDFDRGGRDRDFGDRDRGEDSWRRDETPRDRDGPPRDDWRRDGPSQGDREWRRDSPGDRGAPRDRDDWGRRDGSKRDIDRDGGSRRDLGDRDRGPRRDLGGDGGPRRDLSDRGGGQRQDYGNRDGGPRRDFDDRDRGGGSRPEGDSDNWRKDRAPHDDAVPPRDPDVPPRDDAVPPRDPDVPPRDDAVPPRDPDVPPRDRYVPPRDRDVPPRDRDVPPQDRDVPPQDRDVPPRERPIEKEATPHEPPKNETSKEPQREDNGWETVRRK